MLKFKQSLATFVGLFALLGLFTLATPQQSFGQSGAKVQPAPTPIPVTVTNAPTVKVDPTDPVPVRDVDGPAQQPYQETKTFALGFGSCATNGCFPEFSTVPSGKRLVITNISGSFTLNDPNSVDELSLRVPNSDPNLVVHVFAVPVFLGASTLPLSTQVVRRYAANNQIQLVVNAGQEPNLTFFTTGQSGAYLQRVTITGYYVNVP